MRMGISPYDDLEKEINEWIISVHESGYIVKMPTMRLQALQLAKEKESPFGFMDLKLHMAGAKMS